MFDFVKAIVYDKSGQKLRDFVTNFMEESVVIVQLQWD